MVSTSGHVLLQSDAIEVMKSELFPLATIITPNLPEAKLLLDGREICTVEAMKQAARDLCALGPQFVLIKGGHLEEMQKESPADSSSQDAHCGTATDILCYGEAGHCEAFTSELIQTCHTHGTGCTLASSIAAFLAIGHTVPEATRKAKDFVSGAILASAHMALGQGPQGPLNHCWERARW